MSYSSLSVEELVRACSESGNADAWEEFVCRFHKLISAVIWRIARSYGDTNPSLIDDLVQDTYLKVLANDCRMLRDFQPQHPGAFFGMLRVTARNVANDYFRARNSPKRGSGLADCELNDVEAFVPDPHSGPANIEREIQLQEFDKILTTLSPPCSARDREIFWLYYRHGFTAKDIAGLPVYKLTTKGVESVIHRLTCLVKARLAEREMDPEEPSDET